MRRLAVLALGLLVLAGCRTSPRAKAGAFPPATGPSPASWDDVLAHPTAISMTTLVTGHFIAPRGMNANLDAPEAKGLPNDEVSAEILAHLLRHPTRGEALIDTGLSKAFASDPHGDIHGLLVPHVMGRGELRPEESLGAQLAALHAHPRTVFFTHLHPDHTSGLVELPADVALVAGANESAPRSIWPLFRYDHFARFDAIAGIDFSQARELPPLGRAIDLWGDGSLWAVDAHGHTAGSVMFLVNSREGAVLLTGDACPTRWNFEHDVESGLADDRPAARAVVAQIRAFAARYPQVRLVFGHGR